MLGTKPGIVMWLLMGIVTGMCKSIQFPVGRLDATSG